MQLDLKNAAKSVPIEAPVSAETGGILRDVSKYPAVVPLEAPVKKPLDEYIAASGVELARWVLVIMSGFIVIAIGWLAFSELIYAYELTHTSNFIVLTDGSKPEAAEAAVKAIAEKITADRTSFHEFWLKVLQVVLLNVLLPVLTALLGYVFGTRQNSPKA